MELELLIYLLDIIDWNHVPPGLTQFLQNNPAKDKIKIYILSELIRDFSLRPSFIDYFADAIDRSVKKRVVLKNFDDIIKGLEDLNINHRITLGLALAYSTDEAIRQKGLSYFKLRMTDYYQLGKPIDIPDHLLASVARFTKMNDQVAIGAEELNFWMESGQKYFKTTDAMVETMLINPGEAVSSEANDFNLTKLVNSLEKKSLRGMMNDLGPISTNDADLLNNILNDIGPVTNQDIRDTVLMMCENSPYVMTDSTRENLKFFKGMYQDSLTAGLERMGDSFTGEIKQPAHWNYTNFVTTITNHQQVQWPKVMELIDHPELKFGTKKSFLEFLGFFDILRSSKCELPSQEFLLGKWKNSKAQIHLLEQLIESGKIDSVLFRENKKKTMIDYDLVPPVRNNTNYLTSGMEFFTCKELLTRLVELSDTSYYQQVRNLFDMPMKRYPEILLAALAHITPKTGGPLIDEIMTLIFPDFLSNPSNHTRIFEYVWKHNFDFLLRTFSEVCKTDTNSVNLSRILDITQNVKNPLQRLTNCDDYDFAIPLAILAAKREYINLKSWVSDRITNSGEKITEALVDYINNNIFKNIKAVQQIESASNPETSKYEAIFENFHLNQANLSVIFEILLSAQKLRSDISDTVQQKIEKANQEFMRLLPDNIATADTKLVENETNKILSELYDGKMPFQAFLNKLVEYKDSTNPEQTEIFACVIQNLFAEYPFYSKFSKPEAIKLSGKIFGSLIRDKIVTGMTQMVCLQSILDALKKKDKLKIFGMSALAEIKGMIHLHPNACKSLFEIDQLREGSPETLHEIYRNLRGNNLLAESGITQTVIDDIEKRYKKWQETNNSQSQTTGAQEIAERPQIEVVRTTQNDFESSSLSEEMRKRFTEEMEKYKISEVDSKKHIFILNSIDPGKLDERSKELASYLITETAIGWFAGYLIFNRVPTDKLNLPLYSALMSKINNKLLSKRVILLSYQLINLSCDYAMYKKLPNNNTNIGPEEMATLRNCGIWLGFVTLANNLPILKKDFDIKNRLFLAVENKSITRLLPVIVSIMGGVKESKIFKANNPFIMGILGVLLEIKKETSEKNIAVIDHTFKDLGVNDKQITHFNYIAQKRNVRTSTSQIFIINPLTEYINIDTRALEKYTANLEIDLKQLVAMAIDLAVKDITKPQILLRSVSIALSTTRELALKDFSFESDEDRLAEATQNMLTSLASNLALVTCTEPLRNTIKEKLEHLLESQTTLPEISIKIIKDIATTDNLPLACNIVKRSVIDKALIELGKDKVIQQALERRRLARESGTRFTDEKYSRHIQGLPPGLRPNYQRMPHHDFNIYKNFTSNDQANEEDIPHPHQGRRNPTGAISGNNSIQHESHNQPSRSGPEDRNARNVFDESKLRSLLAQMDVQMDNPNQEERNEAIHLIYGKISKILQSTRDIENYIFPLALSLLDILFKIPESKVDAKLRNYSDILLIYSGYHSKLSKKITEWYFTACNSETKFNSNTLIIFLRRNLIHIVDFDAGYANLLEKVDLNNTAPINCIVFVLKSLVIEERIFTIFTFKKIVEKLMGFHKKRVLNNLNTDVSIFIENLVDFMKNNEDHSNSIKFRLTNLEPEYKKLLTDVEEYFSKPDLAFYKLSLGLLKRWLCAKSEEEMGSFIITFEEEITRKGDKTTIGFFCYIIDISCRQSERYFAASRKLLKLDYTYIDYVSKMVTILLKTMVDANPNHRTNLLEKILTGLIIVLTKEHHCNPNNFNCKLFFKLLFNILYDLNRPDYDFKENIKPMLQTIVQTLHILQPIKYPGFAFAWLQLVSSKYLMAPLLKDDDRETWTHYYNLILGLIIFYREVFTANSLNTAEMRLFYRGTLRLLLVLLHDFPDFLCHFSFGLLEEIPDQFMQVKNIMVSVYPKGMRIPDPFDQEHLGGRIESSEEYNKLPTNNSRIEDRINCYNLQNLIANCIKNSDQTDFDTIMKSLFIQGYKNDVQINKNLLDSFVLYVPYFVFNSNEGQDQQHLSTNKMNSYMLFVKLIKESSYELRDCIINSMLNNLRYPNQITFYFTHMILLIFSDVEIETIHEQIIRNLFERLIIEKPHPWGTLYLLDKLFADHRYNMENKPFYKNNLETMEVLIEYVFDYVKISEAQQLEDGVEEGFINEPQ